MDLGGLLRALVDAGVEMIVVGGAAATAHGAARLTQNIDVVYERSPENLQRLVSALGSHRPYPRGAPSGLPFAFDAQTSRNGANFTLQTDLGAIDLLAEITGGGNYHDLLPSTLVLNAFGRTVRCLTLSKLTSETKYKRQLSEDSHPADSWVSEVSSRAGEGGGRCGRAQSVTLSEH